MNYWNKLLIDIKTIVEEEREPAIRETKLDTKIASIFKTDVAFRLADNKAKVPKFSLEKILRLLNQVDFLKLLTDYL